LRRLTLIIAIVFPALMAWNVIHAQESIRVQLNNQPEDEQFKRSLSILPVYKWQSDQIEPYTRFGVDPPKDQKKLEVKGLPDLSHCRDTGYTFLYFSGADNEINQGYILVLIGNYKRSHRTVYFYIDRNNNLDFRDDGAPDSLTNQDFETIFTLQNQKLPGANYRVKISRFKYGENEAYMKLVREHYQKHSGTKVFTDVIHSYREQRFNTRSSIYRNGNDSFLIALKDHNVNGIYNESCTDQMYVGPVGESISIEGYFDLVPDIQLTAFEWNNKKYEIRAVESTGKFVEIKENPEAVLSNKLEVGKKVPLFSYLDVLNQKQHLKRWKKSWIYLYFWDKESIEAEDTMALRLLYERYGDQLRILALNHGDDPKQVRIIYWYDKVKWPIGFSTGSIASMYFMEEPPRGYLIGRRFRLVNDRISPRELLQFLEEERF
jgi:hypothetical protein